MDSSQECPYTCIQGYIVYSSLLGNRKNIELYLIESGFILVQLVQWIHSF